MRATQTASGGPRLQRVSKKSVACLIFYNFNKLQSICTIFSTLYHDSPSFRKQASLFTTPHIYLPYFAFISTVENNAFSRQCQVSNVSSNNDRILIKNLYLLKNTLYRSCRKNFQINEVFRSHWTVQFLHGYERTQYAYWLLPYSRGCKITTNVRREIMHAFRLSVGPSAQSVPKIMNTSSSFFE